MNFYDILLAKKLEDDRDPKVEGLIVTENGVYSEEGKVYKPVVVNVTLPENTYFLKSSTAGDIVTFNDGADAPLNDLECELTPVQDLHGYDRPWAGGAGANQWDEEWEQGIIEWSGLNNDDGSTRIRSKNFIPCVAGDEYRVVTSGNLQFFYYDSNKALVRYEPSSKVNGSTITIQTGISYFRFYTYATSYGATYKNDIAITYPSTVTTYSPYSNICPISGWDAVNVSVSDEDTSNPTVYSVDLTSAGTVYGGTLDVTTGLLTVDRAEIASYAGETLAGEWISDRDTYQAGDTPTTGAQVVYELATPQTYQLTPTAVKSILGYNNIFANSGDITSLQYFSRERG